uniref:Glutathione transferase n=1 Tax=Percolomonas cosmopolitus TaxID=63605 RepID=A0A7S1PHD4_9EUKA|mmetsp:Transcript_5222/g.19540  ORF Transcript_5222/g.19540 Transcript_5222/m.19540 type:complete len:320 (+) Transcript_5222:75-1034(+)
MSLFPHSLRCKAFHKQSWMPFRGSSSFTAACLHSTSYSTAAKPQSFLLSSFPPSTCSWRLRATLHHFQLNFTTQNVDLLKKRENDTEEYREKWNKMGTVPVLVVREMGGKERRISQSMAAMELLNTLMEGSSHQAHQQLILPSLNDKSLRSDMVPLLQALIVEFAEVINSGMQPMQNTKVLRMVKDSFKAQQGSEHSDPKNLSKELDDRVKREWTEVHLRKGCSKLEHMLRDNRGNESFYEEIPREDQDALAPFYCIGRRLSIADLCFVPQIYAVATRTSIDLAKEFPMVWQTYEKLQGLACFVETDPDHAAKREEYVF